MLIPGDLKYHKSDEWVRVEGNTVTIGITDYAQDQLSDVVYLEITVSEGDQLSKGESFGTVESVKAASDIYAPVSGTVTAINDALADTPEMINSDPYGEAWMIKLEIEDDGQLDELMDASAYEEDVKERES